MVGGGYVCGTGALEAARGFFVGDDAHDARVGEPGRVVVRGLWPLGDGDGVDECLEIANAGVSKVLQRASGESW